MSGEYVHEARPKQARLIAAASVAAGLLVVLLIYRYDLAYLAADTLADRVRASGPVGPLMLIAQAVVAPLGRASCSGRGRRLNAQSLGATLPFWKYNSRREKMDVASLDLASVDHVVTTVAT